MFIDVLTQVIILLILILLGVTLAKSGILTEKGVKSMTDMVLILVTPCVIIKSFMREFEASLFKSLMLCFLITILVHIGLIIICRLVFRKGDIASLKVLKFGAIFSNCGYMAIPLQQALLGDMGVFFGSSYIAIFNVFIWSYGLFLMSGDKATLSPKKLIINPGLIGVALGLLVFLFSIPVPKIISEPISYLASLNTPLPMIIIGYHLANSNLLKGIKNIQYIMALAFKLVVFPLLALGVMYICGIRGTMLVSITICCAAPTAAITTMFSAKYGADTPLAVAMVSLSTILSLISMPLIITLAQLIA